SCSDRLVAVIVPAAACVIVPAATSRVLATPAAIALLSVSAEPVFRFTSPAFVVIPDTVPNRPAGSVAAEASATDPTASAGLLLKLSASPVPFSDAANAPTASPSLHAALPILSCSDRLVAVIVPAAACV